MSASHTACTTSATAHVGRVALRVGSVDRLLSVYRDVGGLDVAVDGDEAVLSAAGEPLIVLHEDPDAPARTTPRACSTSPSACRVGRRSATRSRGSSRRSSRSPARRTTS